MFREENHVFCEMLNKENIKKLLMSHVLFIGLTPEIILPFSFPFYGAQLEHAQQGQHLRTGKEQRPEISAHYQFIKLATSEVADYY